MRCFAAKTGKTRENLAKICENLRNYAFRSISHLSGKSCGCMSIMRYSLRNGAYQDAKIGFGVYKQNAKSNFGVLVSPRFLSYTSYNPQDLPER